MASRTQSENPSARKNKGIPDDGRNSRRPLTHERLLSRLHYDPDTGILRWIAGHLSGKVAGFEHADHLRIGIDGVSYYAQRIIWFYMTGAWPESRIDHRNLNGIDNRWGNLRQATPTQNMANARGRRKSSTLPKGVYYCGSRYRARITKNHVTLSLGVFGSIEEASAAYLTKAKELFGEFARAS